MGLLDTHADGIQRSFGYALRNPEPDEPPASFQLGSFVGAGFKSVARAGLETGANVADLIAAEQRGSANAIQSSDLADDVKAGRIADREQLAAKFGGAAAALRLRSAEMAPDPITAHRADQVLSGVGTGIVRAAGSIVALGPVAGSALFGAGEADTTYHEALDSGHDEATATRLAATTGLISAATAGLPAGGSTIARTALLAGAAGPASFVAQETISRKILQNAGYTDEAAMHDPTDPWGLALSIALPATMGGLHMRTLAKQRGVADVVRDLESGGRRTGADGKLLQSPAGALGEMQVLPTTATDPGFGVRPAAVGPDGKPTADELARVGVDYVAALQQRYGGDAAKTLAAYNAGPGRLEAAIAQHGEDWLAHMPDETKAYVTKGLGKLGDGAAARAGADPANVDAARVRATNDALLTHMPDHPDAFMEVQRATDAVSSGPVFEVAPFPERTRIEGAMADLERQRAELLPAAANLADPGEIRDIRAQVAQLEQQRPDTSDQAVRALAKDIQARDGDGYKPALAKAQKQTNDRLADVEGQLSSLRGAIERNAGGAQAAQRLAELDTQHAALAEQLQGVPLTSVRPARTSSVALAAREALQPTEAARPVAPAAPPADLFQSRIPGTREAQPKFEPAAAKPEAPGAAPKPAGAEPRLVAAEPESLEVQRAEALVADNPDLRVQLPGSTETVSAAEALAQVRAEAERDLGAAELIRAAVQCALTFGD